MSVALGVKVFTRTEKLRNLLESVPPEEIDHVYVADDGETEDRRHLYDRDWPFEFTLIDLEYDAGLGYGRERIVEEMTEEYLLIVDSDHVLPENVGLLRRQLESLPEFGGVSGLLLEYGDIKGMTHDLFTERNVLVRDVRDEKEVMEAAGHPVVPFDFLPNVCLFRRECLEDYCWDPEYVIAMEHLDFYVGHWQRTDWRFGVSPTVLFTHDPRSDATYTSNRGDPGKRMRSQEYFLDKWDYREVFLRGTWLREDWNSPSIRVPFDVPHRLELFLYDFNGWLRRRKRMLK